MEKGQNGGGRLASLDILRGFDMLWIVGGSDVLCAACALFPGGADCGLVRQMCHVSWEGLHFMDLIFPVFIFIAGISFPFSHAKRVANGETSVRTHLSILRRVLLLLALGAVYNGFLKSDWTKLADFRYFSVLGKIGIAWGVAALVYVHFRLKARVAVAFAGLAAYAALLFCTAPDAPAGADSYAKEWNLVSYIDRTVWPNHLLKLGVYEPESAFSLPGGVALALVGMCTGAWLRCTDVVGGRKVGVLALVAVGCFVLDLVFVLALGDPIVKALWTPAFVLSAATYSLTLLALFYWIVDVRGWRRWTFYFRVIGMNSILIYIMMRLGILGTLGNFLSGGVAEWAGAPWTAIIRAVGTLAAGWGVLYVMYRKNAFLRV